MLQFVSKSWGYLSLIVKIKGKTAQKKPDKLQSMNKRKVNLKIDFLNGKPYIQ